MIRPGPTLAPRGVPAATLRAMALDSLRDRICVLDAQGTIVLTNRAWNLHAVSNGGDAPPGGAGGNKKEIRRAAPRRG